VWVDECLADGYEPGDIAIICRFNDRGRAGGAVSHRKHGLSNVVSSESLLINSSPYVRLLVNVAVFLVNPTGYHQHGRAGAAPLHGA
jgi:hypothetical protein